MTDISGGDNLFNATGHNGAQPNRFREFTGVLQGTRHNAYKPSPEAVVAIGRELEAGCRTDPQEQTRALRNIATHSASFKAVDWMYFFLCTGKAVLVDRLPDPFFKVSLVLEPC